jgi:hypothetical protein
MAESLLDRIRRLYGNLPPGGLLPSNIGGAVGGALGNAIQGALPQAPPSFAPPGTPGSTVRELGPPGGERPTTEWDVDPDDEGAGAEAGTAPGRTLPFPEPKDEYERARNQEQRIQWQLEDLEKLLGAAAPEDAEKLRTALRDQQTRLTAQQATVQAAKTAREAAEKKQPHTVQKQEKHPNGGTYLVTYDVDAQGNEKWNGQKPQELFPPSEQSGLQLETAQFNLKKAQSDFAEATSPEAKREAQLKLDLAEFNLQQARAKAGREDRPSILTGVPEGQEWILSRDPTTGAITRERNPAYRAPVGQIIQPGTGRTITTRDPTTGEIKTEPNPAWTPEMEEAQQLELSNLRRGTLPQNPLAAYTQEAQRLQGEAQRELDRLRDLQRTGAITATDADSQFKSYLAARVTPQLAGLKTQAEEAQRLERTQVEERNRLEQIRADTANRAREQVGYQAGETARSQVMQIAPEVRHQGFLNQYGNMVQNMTARAAAPNAEAANALPAAPGVSADQFDISKFAGAIPNLDEAAKAATARALAGISPTAARLANMPTVNMPTGPALEQMLSQLPYQGALAKPPPGLQPLPGMEAVDQLPFGRPGWARTTYPGVGGGVGGFQDWQIPPFGG